MRPVSPRTILAAALLVHGGFALVLLGWDLLVFGRVLSALVVAGLPVALLFSPGLWAFYHPWWLWHALVAVAVARLADAWVGEAYEEYLFHRGRPLSLTPLIGLLASLQLSWLLAGGGQAPETAPPAPPPEARQASPTESPHPAASPLAPATLSEDQQRLSYSGCSEAMAQQVMAELRSSGIFALGRPGWASYEVTPTGCRLCLMVPEGTAVSESMRAFFLQVRRRLEKINPDHAARIEVYTPSRVRLGAF